MLIKPIGDLCASERMSSASERQFGGRFEIANDGRTANSLARTLLLKERELVDQRHLNFLVDTTIKFVN